MNQTLTKSLVYFTDFFSSVLFIDLEQVNSPWEMINVITIYSFIML